jgi:hypothetical protein
MSEIVTKFNGINKNGQLKNLKSSPISSDSFISHVQGIVKYDASYIVSHNFSGASKGIYMCLDGENSLEFNTLYDGFNHPGGMQRIDNYMLVGVEDGKKHSKSHVFLYDLSSMDIIKKIPPKLVNDTHIIDRSDKTAGKKGGACSVGITKYKQGNNDRWLIGVFDTKGDYETDNYIDFYDVDGSKPLPDTNFDLPQKDIIRIKMPKVEYQGIGLLTEADGRTIYLIGLESKSSFLTYADHVNLYSVSLSDRSIKKLTSRHLKTKHNSLGILGVHFRWGAGIDLGEGNKLSFLATKKNFNGSGLEINTLSRESKLVKMFYKKKKRRLLVRRIFE